MHGSSHRSEFARSAGMGPSVPTYDYQCRQCGRTTEVIHSMLEDGPTKCEHCGGQLRRVFHPAGIIFKGSGFYRTDSRSSASGGKQGASKAATEKGSDGGSSGDGSAAEAPKATGSESESSSTRSKD
jgi:putative FmdB family regulatory protein